MKMAEKNQRKFHFSQNFLWIFSERKFWLSARVFHQKCPKFTKKPKSGKMWPASQPGQPAQPSQPAHPCKPASAVSPEPASQPSEVSYVKEAHYPVRCPMCKLLEHRHITHPGATGLLSWPSPLQRAPYCQLPPRTFIPILMYIAYWIYICERVHVREATHVIFDTRINIISRSWILLTICCKGPVARARARSPSGRWLLAEPIRIAYPAKACTLYYKSHVVRLFIIHHETMRTSH